MSKVLYIKASPREKRSYSVAVADAFVEAYKKGHATDEIEVLDLFKSQLPAFDGPVVSGKYKIMRGQEHSAKEKRAWAAVVAKIKHFKSADKYVLAIPMWNFSIPYRLKHYIDIIVQPGQTFTVDESGGYKGLVTGKPICVVYARGGEYAKGTQAQAYDMQSGYIELILRFIGFTDIRSIVVEPTLARGTEAAEEKRRAATERAQRMARDF